MTPIEIHTVETPGLGDRSYVATDGTVAVVVDPQRDTGRVLALAARLGVRITHVLETHVHNDYVSGGLALARATGADYVLADAEDLAFDHVGVRDGDELVAGGLRIRVVAVATAFCSPATASLQIPPGPTDRAHFSARAHSLRSTRRV